MNNRLTELNFKVQDQLEGYKVFGQGEMPTHPMQIGDWWVMPAEQYQGKVPPEVQRKMFSVINSGIEVSGFLIAEDMRVIEERRLREAQKKEARGKVLRSVGNAALAAMILPVIGFGLGLMAIPASLWAFDPILVCVTKGEQKWVCLGEWFD